MYVGGTWESMEAVSEPETLWRVEVAADIFALLYLITPVITRMYGRRRL